MIGRILLARLTLSPFASSTRRALLFQPLIEFRAGQGLEQADHRGGDAAALDKIDLLLKNIGESLSKPTMNPPCTCNPARWRRFTSASRSRLRLCSLCCFGKTGLVGRFDTDKDGVESGLNHHFHQLLVVGQVDRGLRIEGQALRVSRQAIRAGRRSVLRCCLLPMKLSSTKKTLPRQPRS